MVRKASRSSTSPMCVKTPPSNLGEPGVSPTWVEVSLASNFAETAVVVAAALFGIAAAGFTAAKIAAAVAVAVAAPLDILAGLAWLMLGFRVLAFSTTYSGISLSSSFFTEANLSPKGKYHP